MWYWGVASAIAAKVAMEGVDLSEDKREKIADLLSEVERYTAMVAEVDIHSPVSIVASGVKLLKNLTNPSDVYDYAEEYFTAKGLVKDKKTFQFSESLLGTLKRFCIKRQVWKSNFDESRVEEFSNASLPMPFFVHYKSKVTFDIYVYPDADYSYLEYLLYDVFWNNRSCVLLDKEWKGGHLATIDTEFDLEPYDYWGDLEALAHRWPKYKEANVRRTCLLHGRPGTGKTTFSYWLAKTISKKTVLLTNEFLSHTTLDRWNNLLRIAKPDMVIFQDIHQVEQNKIIYLMEVFDENNGSGFVPYIVCTANDFMFGIPEALLRPGRLGDEVYLLDGEPPPEVIDKVVLNFVEELEIERPVFEEHREMLRKVYLDVSPAAAKEILKRIKVEGPDNIDFDEIKSIADLKETHEKAQMSISTTR